MNTYQDYERFFQAAKSDKFSYVTIQSPRSTQNRVENDHDYTVFIMARGGSRYAYGYCTGQIRGLYEAARILDAAGRTKVSKIKKNKEKNNELFRKLIGLYS